MLQKPGFFAYQPKTWHFSFCIIFPSSFSRCALPAPRAWTQLWSECNESRKSRSSGRGNIQWFIFNVLEWFFKYFFQYIFYHTTIGPQTLFVGIIVFIVGKQEKIVFVTYCNVTPLCSTLRCLAATAWVPRKKNNREGVALLSVNYVHHQV